jgi:hypothetical protein
MFERRKMAGKMESDMRRRQKRSPHDAELDA